MSRDLAPFSIICYHQYHPVAKAFVLSIKTLLRPSLGCEELVKLSPRLKFIAITIDELLLVPVLILLAYYFVPDLLLFTIVVSIIGAAIFVFIKYQLVYDALQESTYYLYEMKGVRCVAIENITRDSGKVKLGAEIWQARSHLGEIPKGTEVVIVSREYMKVIVKPLDAVNL